MPAPGAATTRPIGTPRAECGRNANPTTVADSLSRKWSLAAAHADTCQSRAAGASDERGLRGLRSARGPRRRRWRRRGRGGRTRRSGQDRDRAGHSGVPDAHVAERARRREGVAEAPGAERTRVERLRAGRRHGVLAALPGPRHAVARRDGERRGGEHVGGAADAHALYGSVGALPRPRRAGHEDPRGQRERADGHPAGAKPPSPGAVVMRARVGRVVSRTPGESGAGAGLLTSGVGVTAMKCLTIRGVPPPSQRGRPRPSVVRHAGRPANYATARHLRDAGTAPVRLSLHTPPAAGACRRFRTIVRAVCSVRAQWALPFSLPGRHPPFQKGRKRGRPWPPQHRTPAPRMGPSDACATARYEVATDVGRR